MQGVEGVCYVKTVETVARSTIYDFTSEGLAHCLQQGLTVTNVRLVEFDIDTGNRIFISHTHLPL